jgi:hypothetical protein
MEIIFKANLANPKGINAIRFRAENHKDLDLLDDLESSGCLERRDNKYKLSLFALIDLLDSVNEVKDLVKRFNHIFQVLRQYYINHPGECVSLNDLSTMSSIPREDINICLSYMIEAPLLGGLMADFYGNIDASITPSESILKYKDFREVLKTIRSWRSERISGAIESEALVDQSPRNIVNKKALLKKLKKLSDIKDVKQGFPSRQSCLSWSTQKTGGPTGAISNGKKSRKPWSATVPS